MSLSSRTIAVKIIGLLFVFGFALSVKAQNIDSPKQTTISDKFLYAYVFHQVVEFEKQSEKLSDEQAETFFGNYFQRSANLNDGQNRNLKTIARNFVSLSSGIPQKRELDLAPAYRDALKVSLGAVTFGKFDRFIKEKIAPTLKINQSDAVLSLGSSTIFLHESTHELSGYAYTLVYTLAPDFAPQSFTCSVSATMTGLGVICISDRFAAELPEQSERFADFHKLPIGNAIYRNGDSQYTRVSEQ